MDAIRNLTLLIGRIVVGVTFIEHGRIKLTNLDAAISGFEQLGVLLPTLAVWFAIVVEILGGVAFIAGVGLRVFGVLFAVVSLGALAYVHAEQGFIATEGGYELVMVLAGVSLALGFNGGDYTLPALVGSRPREGRDPAPAATRPVPSAGRPQG
jgi:putative oxidoreductase